MFLRVEGPAGCVADPTADICRERGVMIDMAGFEAAMAQQRSRARAASKFSAAAGVEYFGGKTVFHGYEKHAPPGKGLALYREGAQGQSLNSGQAGTGGAAEPPVLSGTGRPGRAPR